MSNMAVNPLAEKRRECREVITSILNTPDSDDQRHIKQLLSGLNQLLRIRVVVPPTSEIMVKLEASKPKLYHATRLAIPRNNPLYMLFQLKGDVTLADKRLSTFLCECS